MWANFKEMLAMIGGSLNLRRLKLKVIRDGMPLWKKVFDLLRPAKSLAAPCLKVNRTLGYGVLLTHPPIRHPTARLSVVLADLPIRDKMTLHVGA